VLLIWKDGMYGVVMPERHEVEKLSNPARACFLSSKGGRGEGKFSMHLLSEGCGGHGSRGKAVKNHPPALLSSKKGQKKGENTA